MYLPNKCVETFERNSTEKSTRELLNYLALVSRLVHVDWLVYRTFMLITLSFIIDMLIDTKQRRPGSHWRLQAVMLKNNNTLKKTNKEKDYSNSGKLYLSTNLVSSL